MISKVTDCPFLDTEHLALIAEQAIESLAETKEHMTQQIKNARPALTLIMNQIDDISLAEINAVQNATIRTLICNKCNHLNECATL